MQFWIIQGLNSLSLGGLLFLLSSGFSLIFGLMRLANLTHGAFFMLGTYFGATAMRSYSGLNIWVTALGAGIAVAAIGGVFNIGSDQPISIRELAERVIAAVDPRLEIEYQSYAAAYSEDFEDVRRRVPDCQSTAGGADRR